MPDHGLINSGHVRVGLSSYATDPDRVRLPSNTSVSNVDIAIACSEISTGQITQRNIAPTRVAIERTIAIGHVVAAGCVAKKRLITVGHVIVAHCILMQ